jgi:hypothetical protein
MTLEGGAMRMLEPTKEPVPAEAPREGVDGVTVAILLVGLLPFVGWAVLGDWGPDELAVATLLVLFALWQLLSHARRYR